MKFNVYQLSRAGGRPKNEDRMGYSYTRDAAMFALADGMGGHPQGDMAAQLALQTMAARFQREARPHLKDPESFLLEAVQSCHRRILRYGADQGLADTPRTTLVACVVQGESAYWAHCGDSRMYLQRGDRTLARTRDHSYAELQDSMATSGAAVERMNRNMLFTCLGSTGKPVIDTSGPHALSTGDRLLLCSDGLWGNVSDAVIAEYLARQQALPVIIPEMVERALEHGGARCDNVTVLAVDWDSDDNSGFAATVSTGVLQENLFATTIQSPIAGEADLEPLDEAEIERSIREINDAIRRASPKKA